VPHSSRALHMELFAVPLSDNFEMIILGKVKAVE
jgi:hypothetical protein